MSYQIVSCEVRWVAQVGYSGNELPPSGYEIIGEFETQGDAARAMADYGLTLKSWGWQGPYCSGYIARVLREIEE